MPRGVDELRPDGRLLQPWRPRSLQPQVRLLLPRDPARSAVAHATGPARWRFRALTSTAISPRSFPPWPPRRLAPGVVAGDPILSCRDGRLLSRAHGHDSERRRQCSLRPLRGRRRLTRARAEAQTASAFARGNPWFPREPPPCGRPRWAHVPGAAPGCRASEVLGVVSLPPGGARLRRPFALISARRPVLSTALAGARTASAFARGNPWFPREPPPCGRPRWAHVPGAAPGCRASEVLGVMSLPPGGARLRRPFALISARRPVLSTALAGARTASAFARGNPWFPREPPPCGRPRWAHVPGAAPGCRASEVLGVMSLPPGGARLRRPFALISARRP